MLLSEQCRLDQQQKSVKQTGVIKVVQEEVTFVRFKSYRCPGCHQQNPKVKLLPLLHAILFWMSHIFVVI